MRLGELGFVGQKKNVGEEGRFIGRGAGNGRANELPRFEKEED